MSDSPDAALLTLVDRFWREHKHYIAMKRRSERLRERATSDPAFPSYSRDQEEQCAAFLRERGVTATWRAWNEAFERLKEQAPAIFALPARTPAGVLAKLRIFGVAYGIDEPERTDTGEVGDEDLYAISAGWLASAVHDLDAIVGVSAGRGPAVPCERVLTPAFSACGIYNGNVRHRYGNARHRAVPAGDNA